MKTLTIAAILWGVAMLLVLVFMAPLWDGLGFLSFFLEWGMQLAGGVIFLAGLVAAFFRKKAAVAALLIPVAGLVLFHTAGPRIGRLVYFQLRKAHYERLLADAVRTGEVPKGEGYTDEGPPLRFAFFWQLGILDNWSGVVYDPTGFVASGGARQLFGGDLFYAEKLQGHWYLCWFT